MATHTPGPFELQLGDIEKRAMSTIHKAGDPEFLIGYVVREWRNPHQREEDDANARLFAAAPDLLAAAQQAQCSCTPAERDSGHLVGCWFPALQAAIEKAL